MKSLLVALSIMTFSITASAAPEAKDCREAIVDVSIELGSPMSPTSFSSREFSEYNITVSEFNALTSAEQIEIYQQVKPLSVMVEEMVARVNRTITYLNNDLYTRMFRSEVIDQYRELRDELRACI